MTTRNRRPLLATLALTGVCAVWGSTFVVVKAAVARMPVADFLTWRFGLATVTMLVLFPRAVPRLPRRGRLVGVLLGAALGAGYLLQTLGLRSLGPAESAFITGLFVVLTPLIGAVLLRHRTPLPVWAAVGLATAGLALLSWHGAGVGRGELLTLGCAIAFALHIVGLGRWAASYGSAGLATLQLLTTTALCLVVAAAGRGLTPPPDAGVWGALALTALAATALAFVVQTWAQAYVPPARAAVVMTMEPVFGAVFAVTVGGERFGWRAAGGGLLVLAAMLLAELGDRRRELPAADVLPRLEQ